MEVGSALATGNLLCVLALIDRAWMWIALSADYSIPIDRSARRIRVHKVLDHVVPYPVVQLEGGKIRHQLRVGRGRPLRRREHAVAGRRSSAGRREHCLAIRSRMVIVDIFGTSWMSSGPLPSCSWSLSLCLPASRIGVRRAAGDGTDDLHTFWRYGRVGLVCLQIDSELILLNPLPDLGQTVLSILPGASHLLQCAHQFPQLADRLLSDVHDL